MAGMVMPQFILSEAKDLEPTCVYRDQEREDERK